MTPIFSTASGSASILLQIRECFTIAMSQLYGVGLSGYFATLPEIADALEPFEIPEEAYVVDVPDDSGTMYELRFFRSTTAPVVGDMCGSKTVAFVYLGFEDVAYTSNSKVPWYADRANYCKVTFDDWVYPVFCKYWFYMYQYVMDFDLAILDTRNCIDFGYMFYYCTMATTLDLSNFDTSAGASFTCMFYMCGGLTSLDVRGWDMREATNMSYMFRNCTALKSLNLSTWRFGMKPTTIAQCFNNLSKCTTIYVPLGCDLPYVATTTQVFSSSAKLVEVRARPAAATT